MPERAAKPPLRSAEPGFQVEVFYACSSDYREMGDSKAPRRSAAGELKIIRSSSGCP